MNKYFRFCVLTAIFTIALAGCKDDEKEKTLSSIAVSTQPTKTVYTVGDTFDPAGMVITATYSDKSTAPVANSSLTITADFTSAGTKTVNISYEGKTTTVTCTVNAPAATLKSIAVTTRPAKIVYSVDDAFDPAGMVVTATFSDNTTAPVAAASLTIDADFSEAGVNVSVTVAYAYEGKTETATIDGFAVLSFTGEGTDEEPFHVETAEEFLEFAVYVNSLNPDDGAEVYFRQTADIHLGMSPSSVKSGISRKSTPYDESPFPIGTKTSPFTGTWDGEGNKITGMYIIYNDSISYGGGLFGYIEGGTVMNLTVEGTVLGNVIVGGIAGSVTNGGSIINCHANVVVDGESDLGGVVGSVGAGSKVINCSSSGSVSSFTVGSVIGGIAGRIDGSTTAVDAIPSSITNCYSSCTVSGRYYIGGVVGLAGLGGSVTNCYATGDVSGGEYNVGGVAGSVQTGGVVSNCYATGAVSGVGRVHSNYADGVGGVAGLVYQGSVTNCAALSPSVTRSEGSNTCFERVAGYKSDGVPPYEIIAATLANNVAYSGMTVIGNTVTGGTLTNINGADIDKNAAKMQTTYSGTGTNQLKWEFGNNDDNPWKMGIGAYSLPVLYWQTEAPGEMPEHLK